MPVSTKHVNEDFIADIQAPTASGESGVGLVEAAFSETDEQDEIEGPILSTEQLSQEMVTLSVVPKSKWQTLLHLDVIKVSTTLFLALGDANDILGTQQGQGSAKGARKGTVLPSISSRWKCW